jgi:tripeptidyl-peptidase-1
MYWLSVLPIAVLAAVPFGLDTRVKHVWGSIPEKWECQGHPPVGTTMDLRIALKPHRRMP